MTTRDKLASSRRWVVKIGSAMITAVVLVILTLAAILESFKQPWLILVTLTVGWAGDPANTLAPAYADMFGRDESFVGLLVTAFGAGSATSSFFSTLKPGVPVGTRKALMPLLVPPSGSVTAVRHAP